ncbi:Nitroreductase [Epibacterium ulvae]|uniref:Nitroreductase n=1 Tax=Epibacterium ulvae TaxID=1156985 RepID=A0A1G5RDA8_9RHOB|nr:nitroreductase family protein [Epibacterium ulvae]SCZ71986.1 Nitroreductase [Epibacterium ulvae]
MLKPLLRRAKALVNITLDNAYDARRYFAHSQSGRYELNNDQLRGRLLQKAHSIEKGLSMPERRSFFGLKALSELEKLITAYEDRGLSEDHVSILMARGAIQAYFEAHSGQDAPANIAGFERLASKGAAPEDVGTIALTREGQIKAAHGDLESVMRSRRSTRMFAPGAVDADLIRDVIEMAGTTPSVCNRQSARVYVVRDQALKEQLSTLQGGSSGFGKDIDTLLIVTSDMSNFRDSRERNQGFVDGGMFSMSLLLALHAKGLGTIPLNWSAGRSQNKKLLNLLNIPDTDLVIMMIGIGQMPEHFEVAASPRRGLSDLMVEITP